MKDLPDNHDISHLIGALEHVTDFDTALDIGAHRGIWTAHMVNVFDRVIAFEPTELYKRITDKAHVINCAVGDVTDVVAMQQGTENTGQSHVIDGHDVDMITIDSLTLGGIDFIKIDVEGMEYQVISGALKTIMLCKPAIMLEENGLCERYGHKWGDAGRLVESLGYRHVGQWNKDHLYLWGD